MAETSEIIRSAGINAQQLLSVIERRPKLNLQAQTAISTLNRLLQQLSDLLGLPSSEDAAHQLQLTMKAVYIDPLEGLILTDFNMIKMGPLNRSKTVPDDLLKQEIQTGKLLLEDLRQLLSRLGGMVFIADSMPPGPISIGRSGQ